MRDFWPAGFQPYGIYLVSATRGRERQLWVVADTADRALAEVLRRLPGDWMITLTGETLSNEEAQVLNIQPNEVRKLRAVHF